MTQAASFDAADQIGTPTADGPGDPTPLTPRLRAILAVVLIADILDLMDSTITNITAPSIARFLGGGESLIKWLGAGYALAIGVLLVVGGRLGDRYGRRRIFLIGITGFTAASTVCGLSVDPALATAIGSAIVTTVFFGVLRDSGGARAMTVSVLVVTIVIVVCFGLVWLLPRAAPAEMDSDMTSTTEQNQWC